MCESVLRDLTGEQGSARSNDSFAACMASPYFSLQDSTFQQEIKRILAQDSSVSILAPNEYRSLLPRVAHDAHKFSRGHVLVIAGSARFPGAAYLAVTAASRSGAGYVSLAAPESIVSILQTQSPCTPVIACPADAQTGAFDAGAFSALEPHLARAQTVVVGPGMTVTSGTTALVDALLDTQLPLLLDADALNAIAQSTSLMQKLLAREHPTIITPHAGEARRLLSALQGDNAPAYCMDPDVPSRAINLETLEGRIACAQTLATKNLAVHVKGPGAVLTPSHVPDAKTTLCTAGTQALATAGSGDVLSGIIGSLMACGLSANDAATLGICVHGIAGRLAAEAYGPLSVTAQDVLSFIPDAFKLLACC